MIASGASNSPTGRWKGRLHREHSSTEFYISKGTFDTLRSASEDSLEEIVYEALVGVLKPNLDGKGYETGIWYPGILRPERSHRFQLAGINPDLGIVALQGRPQDFSGEGKAESIVMLHYLDEESDHGWKGKFNRLFGKKIIEDKDFGFKSL